jgi:hypothetical protein
MPPEEVEFPRKRHDIYPHTQARTPARDSIPDTTYLGCNKFDRLCLQRGSCQEVGSFNRLASLRLGVVPGEGVGQSDSGLRRPLLLVSAYRAAMIFCDCGRLWQLGSQVGWRVVEVNKRRCCKALAEHDQAGVSMVLCAVRTGIGFPHNGCWQRPLSPTPELAHFAPHATCQTVHLWMRCLSVDVSSGLLGRERGPN